MNTTLGITLEQAALWCGGRVDAKYKEHTFFGANNDTRKILPGQLFVALKDVRDGHDFIPMALEKGAGAVLCTHRDGDFPAIIVEDTRKALGDIARGYRLSLDVKVVGITGSVGKSTTKEMTAAVLSKKYRVGKTPVNHNNDIGMPMAILGMEPDLQVMVLEMGMNHFGEMSYLTSIAQPDVAVIVNIGTMHIEHLGSREGILKAKLEILEGLKPGGAVLFNGDEPLLWDLRDSICPAPRYFAMDNGLASIQGKDYKQIHGESYFQFASKSEELAMFLPLEGKHMVMDALAASGVGLLFDISAEEIGAALAGFESMDGRQQVFEAFGCTVIKDCYNAGPESMAASLGVLKNYSGRRIAVLGDMLELGACTPEKHYEVGLLAGGSCDVLFCFGEHSKGIVAGAIDAGLKTENALHFDTMEALSQRLLQTVLPGDTLLFKGSRGMRMERALEALLDSKNKELPD